MSYIIAIFMILAGLGMWGVIISLLLSWWALCFGTVIIGLVMLFLAPHLLLLPLLLSPIANGFLMGGFLYWNNTKEKIEKEKNLEYLEPTIFDEPEIIDCISTVNQQELESQLLLSIHSEDYNNTHKLIANGFTIRTQEFADKCKYLMKKCQNQDLIKLISFLLRRDNY
ncbi:MULTISPECIES: hypothetical protein [Vibrio]|nr:MULTISPECIES: hypothetical protein [Vibrio]HCE2045978.1 hypothetical protein [Vibrio parahaemolyticus]MCG6308943.1 hypothetical protein [Vibrio alginolyticus]MCR9685390.1 hypothetical protein [Vibrio antiquarius]MCX9565952.1 hypothetical protein [Vibrio cholerae]MCX9569433.1 hypothetical protein [Vibrio cholerae]